MTLTSTPRLEARSHNSGIARHSFKESEEGHPVVSRKWFGITGLTYKNADVNPAKVRKKPSWPRSWANFSLLQLYSHRNAWANLTRSGPT